MVLLLLLGILFGSLLYVRVAEAALSMSDARDIQGRRQQEAQARFDQVLARHISAPTHRCSPRVNRLDFEKNQVSANLVDEPQTRSRSNPPLWSSRSDSGPYAHHCTGNQRAKAPLLPQPLRPRLSAARARARRNP